MPLRIIINDKEWSSPVVKYGLALAVLFGTIFIAAIIIFVLLPVIGVSIAATMGLLIIICAGIFAAAVALSLGTAILSAILVLADAVSAKFRKH